MELVTDRALVDRYEAVVASSFRQRSRRLTRTVAGSRFSQRCVIDWDSENVVWAHFHRQPKKYWNAFGVDNPSQRKTIVN